MHGESLLLSANSRWHSNVPFAIAPTRLYIFLLLRSQFAVNFAAGSKGFASFALLLMAKTPASSAQLVVIGGSAGALEPLKEILSSLDAAAPFSVLVVLHTSIFGGTYLPNILARATRFSVGLAEQGQRIVVGRVYIAPADCHLKVTNGHVEVNRGPREHHTRPAVDVLFRSVARGYDGHVIGIVLSGHGSDGTSGALAIRARGGRILAQDPGEAQASAMPQRVINTAGADLVASAREIGDYLARLARSSLESSSRGARPMLRDDDAIKVSIQEDVRDQIAGKRDGQTSVVSCPECGGVLWQNNQERLVDFQCHIGHRYTTETMLVQKTEQLEAALVAALRLLKEKAIILRQTSERARERGQVDAAARLVEQAETDDAHADLLRRQLLEADPSSFSNQGIEDAVRSSESAQSRR
jgi:two-component system chemotaxis response regulator CheB